MPAIAASAHTRHRHRPGLLCTLALLLHPGASPAQSLLDGRVVLSYRQPSGAPLTLANVLCVASPVNPGRAPAAFRSWETDPAGWFRLSLGPDSYTLMFTQPGYFVRPDIRDGVPIPPGQKQSQTQTFWRLDYAEFDQSAWDRDPGTEYYQPFVARGESVTGVGFRLAHDGVDGFGPGTQTMLVSIHKVTAGPPATWPAIGPVGVVPGVDSGGPKNYLWSANWNSGEVPLEPGRTYAVRLRSEKPGGMCQPFWHPAGTNGLRCLRAGPRGAQGPTGHQLWMAVATDADDLLIPYNKRVQKSFGTFAGFAHTWSQTWRAQGRSLAGVTLFAAVGGAQPPLSRQRVMVRVRDGGPGGTVIGSPRVAIGNGIYTGDASWGVFTTAFAPGQIPLTPGRTYALEFSSLEHLETLHGFVNIKKQVSDDRPGFNPYRKIEPDSYPAGASYRFGTNEQPFDLDLQVIEYRSASVAATPDSLPAPTRIEPGDPLPLPPMSDWRTVVTRGEPVITRLPDLETPERIVTRLTGPAARPVDVALVTQVKGLNPNYDFQFHARVRSSWATDFDHQTWIGIDPTGQTNNVDALTLQWQLMDGLHGAWNQVVTQPVHPDSGSFSLWLRARSTWTSDPYAPFRSEFDAVELRRLGHSPTVP